MNLLNFSLLFIIILSNGIHRIGSKYYTLKVKNGEFLFSVVNITVPIFVFLISGGFRFGFPPSLYGLSAVFVLFYLAAALGVMYSIKEGSLAITSLIISYSPLIPTVYGLLFLGETPKITLFIGLVFLVVSLVLINIEHRGEEKKITLKWIIFILLALFGDGIKNIIIKVQQINYNGLYKNEFLIMSFLVCSIVCLVIALCKERENIKVNLKRGIGFSVICGVATGFINLLISILSGPKCNMPASIMFPFISAGGIISSLLVAVFLFKEKLSKAQISGLIMGIVSIVFLSI